jgi:hypothetical protein
MARLDAVKAASVLQYQDRLDILGVIFEAHIGNGLPYEASPYIVQVFLSDLGIQEPFDVVIVCAVAHQ